MLLVVNKILALFIPRVSIWRGWGTWSNRSTLAGSWELSRNQQKVERRKITVKITICTTPRSPGSPIFSTCSTILQYKKLEIRPRVHSRSSKPNPLSLAIYIIKSCMTLVYKSYIATQYLYYYKVPVLTKNRMNKRAKRRLATATVLSRELTAYAWDVAVMAVSSKVKRKMKKLETSTVKPGKKKEQTKQNCTREL